MLALIPLAFELLELAPSAIKLGVGFVSAAERTVELWKKGPATTQQELADLQAMIVAQRARLDSMTADLERDPK